MIFDPFGLSKLASVHEMFVPDSFGKMAEFREDHWQPRKATESYTPPENAVPKPVKDRAYYLARVSKKQDKKGWYAYTHRCRSKSYESIDKIPTSVLKFVESTG